ncbi:Epsin-3, clathrin recruitment and traffic between the Golgi and endosome [Exophiala sp. CCFEE 6169]|uniref:Epsin-3, clathrin recruitment and traffic between the Golgi and endosome n=1 Tax=Vermiconidia calcicola TaxID=1690605 RepID=A0AAV9PX54_9PEZI|nr:Epsin-3, clathrin recruitment and traffic between the Golgi and endosome [Vermiconidia calcicola]KAK5529565.1 Epsin-3, clathrin recruitment and traffic between the Golgi and endosome [Chaetothyriales sp. CCFEE 6169]
MDFESLKNQVSNLTLYDIKAGVRKVQNAVMNLTEMESKVREATNGDPWGAQQLNEIMPIIYKRFTDKTAEEWRQIYKALQLLEYLCKHGSERVIDDARSHLSLLRMLRQFHYIDQNGKDQGINVRNRSAELVKMLSDVDMIRTERKKARQTKNKYGGVEGGMGMGDTFSSGSRYGGFGSETGGFGGYQGEVYGDGGGFNGRETDFSGTQRRADQFEEYDEADDEEITRPTRTTATRTTPATTAKREPPKPKAPEQDLFDFGDEPAPATSNGKAPVATGGLGDFGAIQSTATNDDDDDFDDFQSATSPATTQPIMSPMASIVPPPATTSTTTSATKFAAPTPLAPGQASSFNNILSTASPAPSATSSIMSPTSSTFSPPPTQKPAQSMQPMQPAGGFKSSGPNYFTSVPMSQSSTSAASTPMSATTPSYSSSTTAASLGKPVQKPSSSGGGDAFGSLWSSASNKAGVKSNTGAGGKGPDLASMAKAKSQAGIWGAASASSSTPRPGAAAPTPNTAAGQGKPQCSLG